MDTNWVIVANQAEARIYSASRRGEPLSLIDQLEHEAGRAHVRELVTDAPGRVHDRQGPGRHSMEADVGAQQDSIRHFARRVVDYLDAAAEQDAHRRLIIIAAPAFLGELRKHVRPRLAEKIVLEIPKDMINSAMDKITALLGNNL